jgi:hypothetical protein
MPIGINFRQSVGYVTDISPDVQMGKNAYSSTPGYGWTDVTSAGADVANRNSTVNARLAGVFYAQNSQSPANAEFRIDCGAGTFGLTLALGDAGDNNGPHKVEFFDGANSTAILTVSVAATTIGEFRDANAVLFSSAANWVAGQTPKSITLSNTYLRMRVGGAASGITTIAHMSLAAGLAYTYARPSSDITTQWTPSTGTSHFAMIDEVTASDADYISATAAGQTDEVKLQAMVAPQAGTSVAIGYRVQGITGSAGVTVSMVQGTTVIATDTTRTANGDYTLTVASGTWASVTDWTDIRLRFVSS